MCIDYSDLNKACPKDAYPMSNIDKLVNYSGYNQIPMVKTDKIYTAFRTESRIYHYNVIPFGLKNAGATYQRMMNKVFKGEIGDMLEVYMDDMIVKSHTKEDHASRLRREFDQARRHQ